MSAALSFRAAILGDATRVYQPGKNPPKLDFSSWYYYAIMFGTCLSAATEDVILSFSTPNKKTKLFSCRTGTTLDPRSDILLRSISRV